MNRSKMFLSLTAGLLAIVGAFAAKRHTTTAAAYTQTSNKGQCVSVGSVAGSIEQGTPTLYTNGPGSNILYTAEKLHKKAA